MPKLWKAFCARFYNEKHRAPQARRPAPASSFPGSHPPRPSITSHSPEPSGSTRLPSCVLIWGLSSQRALGPLLPCCALWAQERRPGRALLSDGTAGGTCPFQPRPPTSVRSPRQRQPLRELPRLSPLCEHSPISQAAFTQCRETYPDVASLTCLRAPPEQWLPS